MECKNISCSWRRTRSTWSSCPLHQQLNSEAVTLGWYIQKWLSWAWTPGSTYPMFPPVSDHYAMTNWQCMKCCECQPVRIMEWFHVAAKLGHVLKWVDLHSARMSMPSFANSASSGLIIIKLSSCVRPPVLTRTQAWRSENKLWLFGYITQRIWIRTKLPITAVYNSY